MSQEKQLFTQRIQINPNIFNDIKQDLSSDADITAICNKYKSYETTSWTAKFDDGYEMDIKFCCGNTHDTESNPLWMESVLFDHGCEVTHSEVEEDFHQTWELETESAIYRVEFILKTTAPKEKLIILQDDDGSIEKLLLVKNHDQKFTKTYEDALDAWYNSEEEFTEFMLNTLEKHGYIIQIIEETHSTVYENEIVKKRNETRNTDNIISI